MVMTFESLNATRYGWERESAGEMLTNVVSNGSSAGRADDRSKGKRITTSY